MFGIGHSELLVIGIVALLLFGSRLPQVARSMGKSLTEFKKGLQGVQDEFNDAWNSGRDATHIDYDDDPPSAPRFAPPKSPPQDD